MYYLNENVQTSFKLIFVIETFQIWFHTQNMRHSKPIPFQLQLTVRFAILSYVISDNARLQRYALRASLSA
jgi:hypothetical protein